MSGAIRPLGLLSALVIPVAILLSSCIFATPPEAPIQIHGISFHRSVSESYRYELVFGIRNVSTTTLERIEFRAIAEVSIPGEDDPLGAALVLECKTEIGSGEWKTLRTPFTSPYDFVPPVPMTLTDITIRASGEDVAYPWSVEEEL